jgi:hypothetical protein
MPSRESIRLMKYLRRSPKDKPRPERQGSPMDFTTFVRKPFVVEAVEITSKNIEEVAKYVGDLREEDDGTQYILVDRRLVPNVFKVYPGFFMTKMGKNVRCYSRKIFKEQFVEEDENIRPWLEFMEQRA